MFAMPPAPDLRHTTLDLVDLVHTVSGYQLVGEPNPALTTTAALSMACGSLACHTIEYNPELAREPDYYVSVLCGQILRFFAPPPPERKDLAFSAQGLAAVPDLVLRDTARRVGRLVHRLGGKIGARLDGDRVVEWTPDPRRASGPPQVADWLAGGSTRRRSWCWSSSSAPCRMTR